MKTQIAATLVLLCLAQQAVAQTTTVTKTAPPPASVKVGPATIAPSTTTVYTQPAQGPSGPIPGNQRGSRTDTSYGATVTIPLPEKKR